MLERSRTYPWIIFLGMFIDLSMDMFMDISVDAVYVEAESGKMRPFSIVGMIADISIDVFMDIFMDISIDIFMEILSL
jgi:Na+/melibiose symporter-like transporter